MYELYLIFFYYCFFSPRQHSNANCRAARELQEYTRWCIIVIRCSVLYTLKSRLVNAKLKRKKRRWLKGRIYYNRALYYVYNIFAAENVRTGNMFICVHAEICGWMPTAGCKWKAKLARQTIFDWRDGTPRIVQYISIFIYTEYVLLYYVYTNATLLYIYYIVYNMYSMIYILYTRIGFRTSPLNRPPSTILIYTHYTEWFTCLTPFFF